MGKPVQAQPTWVEMAGIRLARMLGSLQLAVIFLVLFALVVLLGTLMEHWYNTKIAQELVYRSWWFILLLGLLAVNIFCAAAKKWPWKKYQTGFLITHVGLLTLLAGGILNALGGTDANIQLLDTDDRLIQARVREIFGFLPQQSDEAIFSDTLMMRVKRYPAAANPHRENPTPPKVFAEDIWCGALPWKSSLGEKHSFGLRFLNWLQHPLGRSWSMDLGKDAYVEVIDFLPHGRREVFSPSEKNGFSALKVQLRSARFPLPQEMWLANNLKDNTQEIGPALVEILGRCPGPLVDEFLEPPSPAELGKKGVLVVNTGDKNHRIAVDGNMGKTIPVGNFEVTIKKFQADLRNQEGLPKNPVLEFELKENGKSLGNLVVLARFTGKVFNLDTHDGFPQGRNGMPTFWYHAPDVRWGENDLRGVLQFVQDDGDKLFFRSFANQNNGFGRENSGLVDDRKELPIWGKMAWNFRVLEHLPQAVKKERFFPVHLTPGKETEEDKMRFPGAILCKVTAGKESQEIWVGQQLGPRQVSVNGETFSLEYTVKLMKLGFSIKLERAEQTVDPGTRAPASYSSYVQIFDKEKGINGERQLITMNEPLDHRGYKFYQSSYRFLDAWDANHKPVSISGFTVGYDPGLPLKYLGSLMLAFGIACMFYMKAYFFKPRGRKMETAPAPSSEPA